MGYGFGFVRDGGGFVRDGAFRLRLATTAIGRRDPPLKPESQVERNAGHRQAAATTTLSPASTEN